MAGSLTISDDDIVITTIAFNAIAADNEAAFRKYSRAAGYEDDGIKNADTDALNLITEFIAVFFANLIDNAFLSVTKTESNAAAQTTFEAAASQLDQQTPSTA